MKRTWTNPEGEFLGPNDDDDDDDDDDIPFEPMGNFVDNNQDGCPIALVVDVSSSMREGGMLNAAIETFRDAVLTDPVATLRVEVALVAFNHQTEIRPEFSSINEFDPGFLKARGGARICEALNRAIDMIEARKDTC